jgi:hypothetical protein
MADKRSVGRDIARLEDAVDDGHGRSWEERARRYWEAKRSFILPDGDRDDNPDMMDFFPDHADRDQVRAYLQDDLTDAAERIAKRRDRHDVDPENQ